MIPKFRAWIKTEECFADYIESIRFYSKEIDLCWGGICESDCFDFEDVIFMQSTGLKDKNGKEIFEGDIIITNAYGCIVSFGEYTYFEDEGAQITEIGFYLSFLNVTLATYAPFDNYYWENCEVIGNIHENKLDLIMYELHKYNKTTSEEVE
jgi:uncharacterized phage protein (TIGR01671 family)